MCISHRPGRAVRYAVAMNWKRIIWLVLGLLLLAWAAWQILQGPVHYPERDASTARTGACG